MSVSSGSARTTVTVDKTGKNVGFTHAGAKAMEAVVAAAGWTSMPQLLTQRSEAVQTTVDGAQAPARSVKPKAGASLAR